MSYYNNIILGQEELSVLRSAWEPLISPELAALLFAVTKGGLPNQDGCINAVNELLNQLHGPHALQHTGMSSLQIHNEVEVMAMTITGIEYGA